MKKEFLNFIIDKTQKIKFDAVQVLKDVLCRLCEKKLPFFDDNDEQTKFENKLQNIENEAKEIYNKYKLEKTIKFESKENLQNEKRLLFLSSVKVSFVQRENNGKSIFFDNSPKKQNLIIIIENKEKVPENQNIYAMIINIEKYVSRFCWAVYDFGLYLASIRHQNDINSAISSIVDIFTQNDDLKEVLTKIALDSTNAKSKILFYKGEENRIFHDPSFYANGLSMIAFDDSSFHEYRTKLQKYNVITTLEIMLLSLVTNAKVIGLSATAQCIGLSATSI